MRKNILWRVLALMGTFAFVFAGCSVDSGSGSPSIEVESVSINVSKSFQLKFGTTKQLEATVLPENATNKTVTWESSDPTVATVDSSGLVTAGNTKDEVTITAKAGTKSDTVTVKVVEEITFESATIKYTAQELGLAANNASSTDTEVAVVTYDDNGTVTIESRGEGEATITVTDTAGHTATVEIEVGEDGSITVTKFTPYTSGNGNGNGSGDEKKPEWQEPSRGDTTLPGDSMDTPTATEPQGTSIKVKEANGWLNSAYVIFEQVEDAITYKVTVDGTKIDDELIRYYDTYTYCKPTETNGQVSWSNETYTKVVRADALGLKAGDHEIAIYAVRPDGESDPTMFTATVVDHDRSGFAFTGTKTPGAYNEDGTLKSGAIVIYLTQENKKTVKATIGGKEYIGIQDITQAIKTKNMGGKAVAIRVIGTVKAENNDLSCTDHKSSYALGVKEASEVTIEGVGHDATLYGAGVAAFKCAYIEVANLGLMKWGGGKDGDGIALKGGAEGYIWVHNNDVFYGDAGSDGDQVKGDGSMDLKDDTKYVTVAYNHFWDSGKMSLCGMKSESGPNYITYHHNWFDHSDSRHPRIRTMTVHVYNNYFDGNAKYGVGVTTGASAFVESNYFRNAHNPMLSSKQGTDALGSGTFSGEKGGVIKSFNNKFEQNDTNGVKFQLITNKYDYTNKKELGEYKEWYETVGTQNSDGTWTIYDSTVSPDNTIATNSLIAIEDASDTGKGYYQISKGKTGFYIDVPANVQKVIVKAKCGSSNQTGTGNMLSVNGKAVSMNMADNYKDYPVDVSVSKDTTIEIANVHKDNSMNVQEIKVIAASGWRTKLTSGADLTNIDAYEVDERDDIVPEAVKTRSGGTYYSNFDVSKGTKGLGLKYLQSDATEAKNTVITYSGRHYSDFAHTFNNTVDDASYAKNDALNNALVAYRTGLTATQGKGETASGGGDSGSTGGNTGSGSGSTGGGNVEITGDIECNFMGNAPSNSAFTVKGSYSTSKGSATVNGATYTICVKMESSTSITFSTTEAMTLTLKFADGETGKTVKVDGTSYTTDSNAVATASLAAGNHTIAKGDTINLFYISLKK